MASVIYSQVIEEGPLEGSLPREAEHHSKCGAEHRRITGPKYLWRPEYDAYLKAHYFGGLNRRFQVLNRMIRLTGLPRWYIKRRPHAWVRRCTWIEGRGPAPSWIFWRTWRAACRQQRLQSDCIAL